MENTYGQSCTVGRGARLSCDRWTPLVAREWLDSSKRFNDLHRGVALLPVTDVDEVLAEGQRADLSKRLSVVGATR